MESSSTGTKRKLKENAFTAKAENGTLKVKILRRDERPAESLVDQLPSGTTNKGRNRRKTPPPPSNSPPKPRPNRKHVPIFYDTQFRQPIKRGGSSHSYSSSTDESATHSSTTGVPGIHSASSTDVSETAASSSTNSTFISQLSDVRLQSTSSTSGDIGAAPRANPLFVRNDSDGLGALGELLRPYMSSGSSGLRSSFPLGGDQVATTSSAGLLVDQTAGLASALHQLASSSAFYRSALDALSESNGSAGNASESATVGASAAVPSTASDTHNGGMEHYKFDPFSALQTAIDHARRGSIGAASDSTSRTGDKHREIGSPNSNARFYRLEPSGSSDTTHNHKSSSTTSVGQPPELPPAFTLQNSLMGGGISRFTPSNSSIGAEKNTNDTTHTEDGAKDAIAALGPPPDGPPSFLLSNSLTSRSISILDLPKTNPSFDRLGSLTRLISQANEEAKDLDNTLASPPKTNLRLHRLVSSIGMTSDAKTTRDSDTSTSHTSPDSSSNSTHETKSPVIELGPPPSGPPAFTIGNSLMGGGIELQPPAATVNTQNFDWKLHRSASANGGDTTSNTAAASLSRGLRERLERSLASKQNDTNDS
ncbi:hypothetical protein P3T76_013201 [Phytophthora citrophthora]|uniref:Uncharacterized protein n=1 Tax=Phytophthora citrophthora TaxID=4793 RepID=A0AAD9LCJ9_9STRA|nr:hypothetical protein P3T76_013201 [Phytophthora citrophthora]